MRRRLFWFGRLWIEIALSMTAASIVLGIAFIAFLIFTSPISSRVSIAPETVLQLISASLTFGIIGGAFIGGVVGIIVGGVAGAVTALLISLVMPIPRNKLIFRAVAQITNLIATMVAFSLVVRALLLLLEPQDESFRLLLMVMPTILAALGSYVVMRQVIRWYEAQFKLKPPQATDPIEQL